MPQVGASESTEQQTLPIEPEVSEAMKILAPQLVELHVIWNQYCELYSDADTVEVLNRNCGVFFKIVQDVFWDRVLLGICRLLDPDTSRGGRDKNLTLRSLPPLITNLELRAKVQDACDAALRSANFAQDHRNKRIGHQDHHYATNPELFETSPVSRRNVNEILEKLRAVLRCVDNYYSDTDFLYDRTVVASGADRLVVKLKRLEKLLGPSI